MNENVELFLIYVNKTGTKTTGENIYEFLFAEDISIVYGEGWAVVPCGLCIEEEIVPHPSTYSVTKEVKTELKLGLAQNNTCFSYQDVVDGIICVAYEDISEYKEYPENRLILNYGEPYEKVVEKLNGKNIYFQ
jgi:hypothetical protein